MLRHELAVSSGFTRVTTESCCTAAARSGAARRDLRRRRPRRLPDALGLGWAGALHPFLRRLAWQPLFAREPARPASRDYRRWAFESAALDLALRQAGLSLGEALGLPYRPVRFVVSTRLDIRPWLALYPGLQFKLDPTPDWDEELISDIAATGSVRIVDFKAYYGGTLVENPPTPACTPRCSQPFPTPWSRTPASTTTPAP